MNDKKARASLFLTPDNFLRLRTHADAACVSVVALAEQLVVEGLDAREQAHPLLRSLIDARRAVFESLHEGEENASV